MLLALTQGPSAPLPGAAPASASEATAAARPPAAEFLWVLRGSLGSAASIDRVVARAREMGVRGLLVQVVGRGDACYPSAILPRASFLGSEPAAVSDPLDARHDPFGYLVARAHENGIEVHAWVNCLLAWSAPTPPRDPRHVLRRHPEWVARLEDGRSMARLTASQRRRLRVEGVFLAPANPGVQEWLVSIVSEIAERYPVDGIHLDYIRDPIVPVGFDATTRARFALASGVDPNRMKGLPPEQRSEIRAELAAFHRDQITGIVSGVRTALDSIRPGLPLSAAVIADSAAAERIHAQSWRAWLRAGLLDRAFPMCYAAPTQQVMDQLVEFRRDLGADDRVVPGFAVYNASAVTTALKILGARALGFPTLALYSYDSLFERPSLWNDLRRQLQP